MSDFKAPTFHPETGVIEQAYWEDDHFGRHEYGVQFPSDPLDTTHRPWKCERIFPKAWALIQELREFKVRCGDLNVHNLQLEAQVKALESELMDKEYDNLGAV